jgi:hypothetical protein
LGGSGHSALTGDNFPGAKPRCSGGERRQRPAIGIRQAEFGKAFAQLHPINALAVEERGEPVVVGDHPPGKRRGNPFAVAQGSLENSEVGSAHIAKPMTDRL